jgi:hypothetical protein
VGDRAGCRTDGGPHSLDEGPSRARRAPRPPRATAARTRHAPRRHPGDDVAAHSAGPGERARVKSILELRFLRLCAAHDIARPLVNETIGPWTPDFLWPNEQVVVETDGTDFHRTPAKRDRDRRKDAYLTANSLSVTRLTWSDVTEQPQATADRVLIALNA